MKIRAFLALKFFCILAALVFAGEFHLGAIPISFPLFNTGVDDYGTVQSLHSAELHYAVTGAASAAYVTPLVYHSEDEPAWVTAPAGSAWIGPNQTDSTWSRDPIGTYQYTVLFTLDLSAYDPASVRIAGDWASDNAGEIWLNGQYAGFNKAEWGFAQLDHFELGGSFVSGINTLEFRVTNQILGGPNPSGLLVANLSGTGESLNNRVPDTMSTFSALALSLTFLGAVRHKFKAA
jgi:hypothetical protein